MPKLTEIIAIAIALICVTSNVKGSRVGAVVRALAFHQCVPGSIKTRRHNRAEFVGSLLCSERFFSGYSGFPLSSKTNIWFDLS